MMQVPFLDLRVQDPVERGKLLALVERSIAEGPILLGPEVDGFETALAGYCGVNHAVGCASGTEAIFLALKALGIGPGDEVVTSVLSFIGTANGISLTGARPVFADILDDLTIDPESAEAAITDRTRAIMPVHFTGRLCCIPELQAICDRHGIHLVEDAAPAIGAEYQGRRAGSFGTLGCLSLNPMKILNACGEAGAVLTGDEELQSALVALRYNGLIGRERCHYLSTNSRLDTIQAAILAHRLESVETVIERRREIAAAYREALSGVLEVPQERPGYRDVYYTFTVRADNRDWLSDRLVERGIECKIQHPMLMPDHPVYAGSVRNRPWPRGERAVKRVLCIPAHEKLDDGQVQYVIDVIRELLGAGGG